MKSKTQYYAIMIGILQIKLLFAICRNINVLKHQKQIIEKFAKTRLKFVTQEYK